MEITSDYSITRLFLTKDVRIAFEKNIIILKLRPIRDFYEDRN